MKYFILIFLSFFQQLYAKDLQFERLWEKINLKSKAIKAAHEQVEASQSNEVRNNKHWLPTVYLNGQSYLTNDSGAYMFGLLSQKKIEQADFNPQTLNDPGSSFYNKGSIGINLSLYEGGLKTSMGQVSSLQLKSKESELARTKIDFYSDVAKNYFSLSSLSLQKRELEKIEAILNSILKNYQIGNKGNLVGYSGLLGLKGLRNRLQAIKDENSSKIIAYTNALNILAESNEKINFQNDIKINSLINEYLNSHNAYRPSDKINSFDYNSQAAREIIEAENSRNRPRIGVFAEANVFNGKRDTATGYSTGIYLNWNLFSGNDFARKEEAIHNAEAAKYYSEAMSQKERIDFEAQEIIEETLNKTILTLEESERILNEQTLVANNLFKNGMINALQLAEVLNRRVDLINSKTEVEVKLVEAKAKKLTLTKNQIEIIK